MTDECRHGDCAKVKALLSEYLDEELQGEVLLELNDHIRKCPDCHLNVDSVRKVIRLYRAATETECPVDIRIRLEDVIRRARTESGPEQEFEGK
ncbi:zf-HC2 domain-containing protein [bacterium]|nr:zf-HC2 domain-containing protein [bacterium]